MLNNKKLAKATMEVLHGIPIGDPIHNTDYMTKIGIYDAKCGKCGFNRIEVGDRVFHNVDEAINYAIETGYKIVRTCEFPGNTTEDSHGNIIYPTLSEIIENSCMLWDL